MTHHLITRISKLDAPDREVDALIEVAVRCIEAAQSGLAEEHWANWQASPDGTVYDPHTRYSSQSFTASIDAAVSLAERVLPGWYWGITQGDDGEDAVEFQGNVWPSIQPYPAELEQYGYHKFPAIALLIALLRAKEANQ